MMMTLQQLRDIEDNKHIDSFIESDDSFNDWEKKSNPEYISTYYEMLSILYQIMDENDEIKAIKCAEDEMEDWMNSIKDSMNYNYSLAKIHACKDFLNGEDAFGDNYD
jgi:hypothetical protein